MVSFVNSHTNATRIGWHMWEIDLRFAPGLPPGWGDTRSRSLAPNSLRSMAFGGGTGGGIAGCDDEHKICVPLAHMSRRKMLAAVPERQNAPLWETGRSRHPGAKKLQHGGISASTAHATAAARRCCRMCDERVPSRQEMDQDFDQVVKIVDRQNPRGKKIKISFSVGVAKT